MHLKLDFIKTFCTVADCNSIVIAAKKMGRTPAAVSMTLKKLEEEIGTELFEGERKNKLTAMGAFFLEKSRRQLEYFERFETSIERFIQAKEGAFSILSVPSITKLLVAPCIKKYREEARNIHFTVGDMSSKDIIFRIKNGHSDLGIISNPHQDALNITGLENILLFTDRLGVAFHRNHDLAKHRKLTWEDCEAHELLFNPLCRFVTHDSLQKKMTFCPIEANNNHSILAILSEGIGFSVLPESLKGLLPPELVFALPEKSYIHRDVVAIFGQYQSLNPSSARMLEILREEAKKISEKIKLV